MEWKYVEEYSPKDLGESSRGETRRRRYARLYAESPAFNGKAPFEAWLFEPFYLPPAPGQRSPGLGMR